MMMMVTLSLSSIGFGVALCRSDKHDQNFNQRVATQTMVCPVVENLFLTPLQKIPDLVRNNVSLTFTSAFSSANGF